MTRLERGTDSAPITSVMGRDVLREFFPGKLPTVEEMNDWERAATAFVKEWKKAPTATQVIGGIQQLEAFAHQAVRILDKQEVLWGEWVTRGVPPPKILLGSAREDVWQALKEIRQGLQDWGWKPYSRKNISLHIGMKRQLRHKRSRRYDEDPFAVAHVTQLGSREHNSSELSVSSVGDAKSSFDGFSGTDKCNDSDEEIARSLIHTGDACPTTHSGFNPTLASTVSKSFASYLSGLSNVTKRLASPSLLSSCHTGYNQL